LPFAHWIANIHFALQQFTGHPEGQGRFDPCPDFSGKTLNTGCGVLLDSKYLYRTGKRWRLFVLVAAAGA
jgi:hypothetical protein